MAWIDEQGYVVRKLMNSIISKEWTVTKKNKMIQLNGITLPSELTGKKIRLKVEVG